MTTSSPWELSELGAEGVDILSRDFPDGRQMRIATVQPWPGFERTARLMVASKEMYAALQATCQVLRHYDRYLTSHQHGVLVGAEVVLFKAVPR